MNVQPPNTFSQKIRKSPAQQQIQYRPEDLNQYAPATLEETPNRARDLVVALVQIFRQVFDLIYAIRDAYTPAGRSVTGDFTADPVDVPAETSPEDRGTSLGLQITLNRPGNWLVQGSVCLSVEGDTDIFTLSLLVGQTPIQYVGLFQTTADQIVQLHQQWFYTSRTADEPLTLWIKKEAGAGTSNVILSNSTFSATWQGL